MRPVHQILERLSDFVNPERPLTGTMDQEAALKTAEEVKQKLGHKAWFRKVGVSWGSWVGFYVTVIVDHLGPDVWNELPAEMNGIKIEPAEVRDMRVPSQNVQREDLLSDLAALVEGVVNPAQAARVAKVAQHRFGKNGWFISAKPTRSGNGVRINIFKPYGEKPKLPKVIHGVPIRIERKKERPAKDKQAPAKAKNVQYATIEDLTRWSEKLSLHIAPDGRATTTLKEATPLPATAGTPPGTPPKIQKPGDPANANPLTADPALAPLTVAALNTGLKSARLKMKKGVAGQSGDILPDDDSDKADDDADKALDALSKIAQSKGIPKPRIKQLVSREVPGPHGTTGDYRVNPATNKIELR